MLQYDDRDVTVKKMRFTPQPATQADTSHVSDSTPAATLSVEQQRDWWKQEAKRLRKVERDWIKRQDRYEETARTYKLLEIEKDAIKRQLSNSEDRNEKLREQLNIRTNDNIELRKQLDEQRSLGSLSEDEKVLKIAEKNVQIDTLKEELAKQVKATDSALASKTSADNAREFVQERFRDAQGEATSASQELEHLRKENARLKRAEKAQPLKTLHQQRQEQLAASQASQLAAQNNILKKQLEHKTKEADKWKAEMERMRTTRGVGGGTRAASAGPRTPRPGSRAASPLPNGRDRVANLRNG